VAGIEGSGRSAFLAYDSLGHFYGPLSTPASGISSRIAWRSLPHYGQIRSDSCCRDRHTAGVLRRLASRVMTHMLGHPTDYGE